jgi:parvulin-like peptidyl-prolyl isomerase
VQSAAFDQAAFALDAGQLSGVVQDAGSYKIIQVIEKDPARPLADSQLTTLRTKAFNDWLSGQRGSQDVKIQLGTSETNWILARLGVRP